MPLNTDAPAFSNFRMTRAYSRNQQWRAQLALKFSLTMTTLALAAGSGAFVLWLLTGQRYPQLVALIGVSAMMAAGAGFYRVFFRVDTAQSGIVLTLIVILSAAVVVPLITSILLPAGVAAIALLTLAAQTLLERRASLVLVALCMVALIGVSVLVQSVSVSLFDETLTAQFEQSPIAVLGNFPVILGFIVSGRQLLLRYERALEDEHALVRTLIDTLPDNLFVKDRESRIVIDNVAHARLLGNSTPDQVIGKTDFDFFPPELAQKYYEDEQQIIRTGEAKINLEETTIDPQGNEHWLMTSKVLIRDEAGQIAGIVGINRDITEQKRIEIERDQSLQVEQDQREYLQMLIGKIRASASILNNVAAEIQVATTQQVASTLEQETAVTQTVATVEEVRTTVQQTAERAQQVAHTATESVSTSRTGQEAVAQTVDSVSQIKQQVEDIAGSILALSERTQQIGEIIDTVNGLADQSKLLALNASIEAARAGEEGKGFAVVAMEVRQLAEQSREATGRVRDILSEIQQATNSAVMVTEQGSKGAEIGLSLVELAGEAIRELAVTIEGAAQAATQIAASTHQQTNGMEQLAAAMMQIKAASGQSAVSARQTENSVREMIDIAQQLEAAVAQYQ